MAAAKPDPRIADYIAEIEQPGIPAFSRSHITLRALYAEHGKELIARLVDEYFAAKRAENEPRQ